MLDLELLQVADALVGVGHVAQQLVGVDQHQPGPVDGEELVGGVDDPAQGVVEVPGGVAQVPQLVQRLADLSSGHRHGRTTSPDRACLPHQALRVTSL